LTGQQEELIILRNSISHCKVYYMSNFFEKNKVPISIVIAGFLIAGAMWLSKRPVPVSQPGQSARTSTSQKPSVQINYTEAANHVGEFACVSGEIDHVYTSGKGTVFLNFCPDYKTCPFGAVIFNSDAYKFPNPKQYEGRTVQITGLIRSYQGRPEIILKDSSQIGIISGKSSSVIEQSPGLYRVVRVVDGDTIKVDIAGEIETVRLIGIDTPELAGPDNPKADYFGPEAALYAKRLLENQSVYLIPDPMQSGRDKYDRLLRYVFLEDGTLVNAKLIAEGYAFNYMYEPFQFMKQFDYLEKQAKENQLGLWKEPDQRP
jgi:endonuclease YncB( thermonuclease family)